MASTGSPVLAGPPRECCTRGVKHFGEPAGKTITIADIQTYISEPPAKAVSSQDKKKIILYLADIFGPFHINAQLLQDYYASRGESQKKKTLSTRPVLSLIFTPQGSSSLGLTTFLEMESSITWINRVLIGVHG